ARRIDEGDLLAVMLDLIGANVLGDTTGFTGGHTRIADRIERRGLAVVNVTHDRDNRRTRLQIFRAILDVEHAFFNVGVGNTLDGVAKLNGNQFSSIRIDHVAGLHHLALFHEELDQIYGTLGHTL